VEERLEAKECVVAGLHQQLGAKQVQVKKLRNYLKADLQSRVSHFPMLLNDPSSVSAAQSTHHVLGPCAGGGSKQSSCQKAPCVRRT